MKRNRKACWGVAAVLGVLSMLVVPAEAGAQGSGTPELSIWSGGHDLRHDPALFTRLHP